MEHRDQHHLPYCSMSGSRTDQRPGRSSCETSDKPVSDTSGRSPFTSASGSVVKQQTEIDHSDSDELETNTGWLSDAEIYLEALQCYDEAEEQGTLAEYTPHPEENLLWWKEALYPHIYVRYYSVEHHHWERCITDEFDDYVEE